jgi:hypothetical protein
MKNDHDQKEDLSNYDYEIIVGLITTVSHTTYSDYKEKTTLLPVDSNSIYIGFNWFELSHALEENGIKDQTFHFDKICCEDASYYFGRRCQDSKTLVVFNQHLHEPRTPMEYILYCPFCGTRLKFTYKNLGKFKFTKEKREVCSIVFKKVE